MVSAVTVALVTWMAMVLNGWIEPITSLDEEQPRLTRAAPAPQGSTAVAQTFTARHNGLSAIELLAVVYPQPANTSDLTLRLTDEAGHLLAEQIFHDVAHNTPLRFSFSPLATSAGRTYTLQLIGHTHNRTTAWAYELDGYMPGELKGTGGDPRFTPTYTYLPADMLQEATSAGLSLIQWGVPLWLILFVPGLWLLAQVRAQFSNVWVRWGMALGLSLALLPLIWQWVSVFGVQLNGRLLIVTYGLMGVGVVLRTLSLWRHSLNDRPHPTRHDLAIFAVLLIVTLARFLAARDLDFPMWVDSPHHALVFRVLAEAGQVPTGYAPTLAVDEFTYHFGFHALAVTFHWFTALPVTDTFLLLGHLLNGLMALAAYAFTVEATGRARAALAAAFFVGAVSLMPGYYLAWGRYTQLTGLVILAPLLGATWRLVRFPMNVSAPNEIGRLVVLTAVLVSGLLIVHYRVAFFFATFAWAALAAGRQCGWKSFSLTALVAIILTGPWLWRLSAHWLAPAFDAPNILAASTGHNDFPWEYFDSSLERSWLIGAGLTLALKLFQRERVAWLIAGWLALTSALLNFGPGTWVVNNNSWAISLFLPGAVLAGWGVDSVWNRCSTLLHAERRLHRAVGVLVSALLIVALSSAAALGLRAQLTMANPTTTLALAADRPALEWVRDNTPPEAIFVANSWLWQHDTWAGSDGGAWLVPFAHRQSTIPPVDYAFDSELGRSVNDFNQRLSRVTDANAPETLALFRKAGVTHVFIGARGGVLKPEIFVDSPYYRLRFTNGAAWVFEVQQR